MSADKPPKNRAAPVPRWQRAGLWTAVLITLWIAALHVLNLLNAGPLWRDEIGTVDFAAMPTMGDIWHNLRYDNFPPLFVGVARVWTLIGLSSDFGYRLLGFLIGLGTLGVLWLCARKLGARTPLLVLALYAANPLAIRVGDSLRPYGLGIVLILLTAALIWNFTQTPGRRTLFWAALAATLSVQCLYQNAFFIMAFSCGAWAVALGRKDWKTAWQTGIIGLVAAISLLPYGGIINEGQEWLVIAQQKIHFDSIWQSLCGALQVSGGWMAWVWLALCIAALAVAVFYGARQQRWGLVYCGTVLAVGAPLYLIFIRTLDLVPHPWYFLILMAQAALMLDSIFGGLDNWQWQIGRAALSVVLVAACIPACDAGVRVRQTNMDLVAAKLKEMAQPEDLIVVSQWYFTVSLQRYLDASRWTTLPPLEDVRIHRYDLVKKAMMSDDPIGPLLDKVRATLRSGHKLWVVGLLQVPPDGKLPPVYPPYSEAMNMDMPDARYYSSWMFQFSYLVKKHVTGGRQMDIPVPGGQSVNPLEDVPLLVAQGWRE